MAEGFKCMYCGSEIGTDLVILEATTLAGRLWTLNTCGPCHLMLKAAIQLELAGGGPGGHFEVRPGLADVADELAGEHDRAAAGTARAPQP